MRPPPKPHEPVRLDLRCWPSQVVLAEFQRAPLAAESHQVVVLAMLVLYELLGGLIALRAVVHERFEDVVGIAPQLALLGAVDGGERGANALRTCTRWFCRRGSTRRAPTR
eukprot:5618970-Pyramimonas_sp.AAC.1